MTKMLHFPQKNAKYLTNLNSGRAGRARPAQEKAFLCTKMNKNE